MTTAEISNVALRAEAIEPMAFQFAAPQPSAVARPQAAESKSKRDARLRFACLAAIALLAVGLGFIVLNSLHVIEAELDAIHATIVSN